MGLHIGAEAYDLERPEGGVEEDQTLLAAMAADPVDAATERVSGWLDEIDAGGLDFPAAVRAVDIIQVQPSFHLLAPVVLRLVAGFLVAAVFLLVGLALLLAGAFLLAGVFLVGLLLALFKTSKTSLMGLSALL